MAYTQGDIILDNEYNIFAQGHSTNGSADHNVANLNTVWGVGNGNHGYGQSTVLSGVAADTSVTATQWSTLMSRVNSAAAHQGLSAPTWAAPAPGVTTGDIIKAVTTLQTNINNIWPVPATFSTGTTSSDIANGVTQWDGTSTHTFTLTFGSVDQARYFFNAGGEIQIEFEQAGGTSNAKNVEWRSMAVDAGQIIMSHTGTRQENGGGGAAPSVGTTIGYYDLTTGNTQIFKMFSDTGTYSTNYLLVQAKTDGAAGSNGGNGSVLTIIATFVDAHGDYWVPQRADGTYTATMTVKNPSTTNITTTWGTPTKSNVVTQV